MFSIWYNIDASLVERDEHNKLLEEAGSSLNTVNN